MHVKKTVRLIYILNRVACPLAPKTAEMCGAILGATASPRTAHNSFKYRVHEVYLMPHAAHSKTQFDHDSRPLMLQRWVDAASRRWALRRYMMMLHMMILNVIAKNAHQPVSCSKAKV